MKLYLDTEIRTWVARYVTGQVSLHAFQQWFTPTTWNIEKSDNKAAEELTYDIELRLAEYTHGDWTEQELKDLLAPLAITYFQHSSQARVSVPTADMQNIR